MQGSNVLELLDLSLVGKHERPGKVHYDADGHAIRNQQRDLMSPEVVLPLVESIIASDGFALRYTVFPCMWNWRAGNEWASLLEEFRRRYNERFERERLSCANCSNSNILSTSLGNVGNVHPWMDNHYQYNVCYDCLKPICRGCTDGEWSEKLRFCDSCSKYYCSDCVKVGECEECSEGVCRGCNKACDECGTAFCKDVCIPICDSCGRASCMDCDNVLWCSNCRDKANCRGCYNGGEYNVDQCRCCRDVLCSDCVPSDRGCWGCIKVVKIREQAKEIEELKEKLGTIDMEN